MKIKEVPQHNDGLMEGHKLDVCYVVDEDGNYVTVQSSGWKPKNDAMLQAWELVHERIEETRIAVLEGKMSPIAYFMEKHMMDVDILSQYVELPKRKIRRHLKPRHFLKLDDELLRRYAAAFEISVELLKDYKGEKEKDEENG